MYIVGKKTNLKTKNRGAIMIILLAVITFKLFGFIGCDRKTIFVLFAVYLISNYIDSVFFNKQDIKYYNSPFTKD